jgi:plasmid maintenance system killer protein
MNVALRERAISALASAPPAVQKAFIKQMNFLARSLQHPSLHAKKYNEAKDLWQARINDDWRFYFTIEDDAYIIHDVIPHPK